MSEFSENLRLACSKFKSISYVCRETEINRQQFNRYLNGSTRPSAHNLTKIIKFFNLSDGDFDLDPRQFQLVVKTTKKIPQPISKKLQSNEDISKYLGYYFCYFYSIAEPDKVTKSILRIYKSGNEVITKGIEIIRSYGDKITDSPVFKYSGYALLSKGAFYIREHETMIQSSISQTTLIPCYRNRISILSGLTLGVPSTNGRIPGCSRIAFEWLGDDVNLRNLLSECARYPMDSAHIPMKIQNIIGGDDAKVFYAKSI